MIGSRFAFEVQGNAHWFLGTRIYRENDGSYLLDQETYSKHILNRYCGKESSQANISPFDSLNNLYNVV